jgi:hypothetical protein
VRRFDGRWSKDDAQAALAAAMCAPAEHGGGAATVPPTLGQVVDEYLQYKADRGKRSLKEDRRILKRQLVPAFGAERRIGEVTGPVIAQYERQRGGQVSAFVIVNLALQTYGLRDFELTKPAYLTAGLSFVAFVALACVLPTIVMRAIARAASPKGPALRRYAALLTVYGAGLLSLVAQGVLLHYATEPHPRGLMALILSHETLVALGTGVAFFIASYREGIGTRNLVAPYGVILLVAMAAIWGVKTYPTVNPAFGGGRPILVELVVVDDKAAEALSAAGVVVNCLSVTDIRLVDEAAEHVTMLLRDGRAVRIKRDQIRALASARRDGAPPRTTVCPQPPNVGV